jgi:hypothetical protein
MSFILYAISYLLIVATFFNDGFTGMFFAFPFLAFIAADSLLTRGHKKLIVNSIVIGILFILSITRFSNPYIYPILNKTLITTKEHVLLHSRWNINELVDLDEQKDSYEMSTSGSFKIYKKSNLYKEYLLKKGTLVKAKKVKISGHPDILGISYELEIDIKDDKLKEEIIQYITMYNSNKTDASDKIYAGEWFFEYFPKNDIYRHIRVENIFEKNICQLIMIFNPMAIWIYLIIVVFQIRYIKNL